MTRKLTRLEVHAKVRRKYNDISRSLTDRFKYLTGKEGAITMGYEGYGMENIPEEVLKTFCGVGNPFVLGPVQKGDSVLDVGCGGGIDVAVACGFSGKSGAVIGIDLVEAIAFNARRNITASSNIDCSIVVAGSESIPFGDELFDVVISNAALYLSPLKEATLREIFRVLKPDGRFQFADVVIKDDVPEKIAACFDGWSG